MKTLPGELKTALRILEDKGYEAYLVGGAVRNYVLNEPIKDYDITTNADPNAIRMAFHDYRIFDIGKKHGTVAVLIGRYRFEITPYRLETTYDDHRHPDEVIFTSNLLDDLKRRDFTINAMCLDSKGHVIDHFHGLEDLENRTIRAIGDPHTRFSEDALRILRALRFKAKLDFTIEKNTEKELFICKDLLGYVSIERKRDELLQILACKNAFRIINDYPEIFNTFIPLKNSARKNNDFSSPFCSLAYLLKDTDTDPGILKLSNQEKQLVNDLRAASHIRLSDDYEFIKCLSGIHQKQILQYLKQYHHRDLDERYRKLKRYMCTVNDLKISGEEIAGYGYRGRKIGAVKNELTDLIHQKKLLNNNRCLNEYLKENIL